MNHKQGFVRLNHEQKRILDLIKANDGYHRFFAELETEYAFEGLSYERVIPVVTELQDLGYLKIIEDDNGLPVGLGLSSWAYCYGWEYFINLVLPTILSVLSGVSGGLVVWLLTRLFAAA